MRETGHYTRNSQFGRGDELYRNYRKSKQNELNSN